jgi:hypothetical protein
MNKKKIVLNLDERTFQYLEVLAFGLNLERHDGNQDNKDRRATLPVLSLRLCLQGASEYYARRAYSR